MPYIGISPRIIKKDIANNPYDFININMTYCHFINNLGYEYLILPLNLDINLLNICDGYLIIGGNDVNPEYYFEKNRDSNIEPKIIDEIDFKIIDFAINQQKFILGICRGIQVINVYFGGSLIQDLNDENHLHHHLHQITKISDISLIDCFNEKEIVNSLHHQAINKLGDGLIPLFKTNDIIEMIIHHKYKIIGVQWHPERLDINHQTKFKEIINKIGVTDETKTN